jgi:hypothetical protein
VIQSKYIKSELASNTANILKIFFNCLKNKEKGAAKPRLFAIYKHEKALK